MLNSGYILTAAEMVIAEQAVMDEGVSIHDLMQRAGTGAAQQILRVLRGKDALILCGPGNNGGDGYVIARYLLESGISVKVAAMCDPKTEAARQARSQWTGPVADLANAETAPVLIDCLFGTGLTRGIESALLDDYTRLSNAASMRIAIDVPSGIQSDTGEQLNKVPDCDLTIALGAYKPAHFLEPAKTTMGQIVGVDIGISAPSNLSIIESPLITSPLASDHKYTRGLVAVVAGKMHGAAKLTALAAQRSGAGYVKIFTAGDMVSPHHSIVAQSYTDIDELVRELSDKKIGVIVIGPGLGRDGAAETLLDAVLSIEKPIVLDADALMILGDTLSKRVSQRAKPVVITPHEGEFSNLGELGGKSRINNTRNLSRKSGAVLLLKGSDTVISNPDGHTCLQNYSSSWLSTAGTGDVLSGIIAARLAVEEDGFIAAKQSQWLHSRAARLAGPSFSPEMLIDQISAAIQECI